MADRRAELTWQLNAQMGAMYNAMNPLLERQCLERTVASREIKIRMGAIQDELAALEDAEGKAMWIVMVENVRNRIPHPFGAYHSREDATVNCPSDTVYHEYRVVRVPLDRPMNKEPLKYSEYLY
jgi:hypothetical protein